MRIDYMTSLNIKAPLKLRGIQYLRGIASLAVLIFHTSETYHLGFFIGAAGVDLFFVISGLIMWITTSGRSARPTKFLFRRLTRIIPIYWLATFATFGLLQLKPHFFFGHNGSPMNLVRSLFFVPELYNGGLRPTVLQCWTLCYEMFFYILFAMALLFRERMRLPLLVGTMCLLAAAHLVVDGPYSSTLTNPIILEFAAGLLIGNAAMSEKRISVWTALGLIFTGTVGLIALRLLDPALPRFLAWGMPSFLIVAGVVFFEQERGFLEIRWLHFIGDASYSIYIWHVLAGVLVTAAALRFGVSGAALPFAVVFLSIPLTILAYLVIEQPTNWLLKLGRRETIST